MLSGGSAPVSDDHSELPTSNQPMSSQPKVSVIVPVYNVEPYIRQCLESLCAQTLREIEIILIDDGSTDRSGAICQEYAARDSRIMVLRQPNGGQSAARNAGLQIARGEYIGFADPDDWCDHQMYARLYQHAREHDSDMVFCGAQVYDESLGQFVNKGNDWFARLGAQFDHRSFCHADTAPFLFELSVALCTKFFKRSFLEQHTIRFLQGLVFEDVAFFYQTYLQARRVAVLRQVLYCYRIERAGSTTTTATEKWLGLHEIFAKTLAIFKSTGHYDMYRGALLPHIYSTLLWRLRRIDDRSLAETYFARSREFLRTLADEDWSAAPPRFRKRYMKFISRETFQHFMCGSHWSYFRNFLFSKIHPGNSRARYQEKYRLLKRGRSWFQPGMSSLPADD